MRLTALMICAAATAIALAMPLPAQAESLNAAIGEALNQHPSIQAALAGRDAAREQGREARSGFYPELNVNAATGRVYGDNSTSRGLSVTRGAGYSWNHEGGITARQMIFDGMETARRTDAAAARLQSANLNIIDIRENLGLRVAQAYIEVLRTRETLALLRDHAVKIADYRRRIDGMVAEGAADESMAVQAHDIQNQLDGTLADVEGQLKRAMADYAEAVGRPLAEPLTRPALEAGIIPDDVEQAVQAARENHPALKMALYQGIAAGEDMRAEKGTLYPDLSGELSAYKRDVDDIIGGEVIDNRALVRMNWDFSTGGAQMARVRQAAHKQAEAQARAADLSGKIEREIRKAYADRDSARDRLAISRDRVQVSTDLVGTYERQFEAARATLLSILQAENTLFNARLGVVSADYRLLAADYAILASTGQLQRAMNILPVDLAGKADD